MVGTVRILIMKMKMIMVMIMVMVMWVYFNIFGFQRPSGHIIRQSQPEPKKKVPSVQI